MERDRKCLKCGIDINEYHCAAVRCKACSKEHYIEYQMRYREKNRKAKTNEEVSIDREYILELRLDGMSIKEISEEVNVSVDTVCKILNPSRN